MNVIQLIYLIPLLPLIGFLVNGLGRNHLSKSAAGIVGSGSVFLSFCLSVLVFNTVRGADFTPQIIHLFNFIDLETLRIAMELTRYRPYAKSPNVAMRQIAQDEASRIIR